ncbi:integral membrane protein [Colletotrichum simmondsii]|uniref:Integral membrane protein n=1 Tax=Colletotrichum simmondsii TaxID=703756 RepID=A0A135SNF7_9PEZI|nr:integral membrane protein [Colletotrichum simmondsii]
MRIPPIDVLIHWPRPNYINPENRGPGLLIIEMVFLGIALICLCLRMYIRIVKIRQTWWDDWLMVAGMIFCIGVTICVILGMGPSNWSRGMYWYGNRNLDANTLRSATELYGWNLHVWDVPLSLIKQSRQISMAAQTLFLFASGLSKLSILASYLRLAAPGTWFQRLTWVTGGLVFTLVWVFLIVLWTQCMPIWHYWTLFADWGNCIPEWPPLAGQGITNVLTDIAVYVLPMPTLFRLQMPLTQRISLIILFGLGTVVVLAGIMRTYWVIRVEVLYVEDPSYDLTWDGFNIWFDSDDWKLGDEEEEASVVGYGDGAGG